MEEIAHVDQIEPGTVEVGQPLEGPFGKYFREYRLLNSLLFALFFLVILLIVFWSIIFTIPSGGEPQSDFVNNGPEATAPKKQEQKVRLMQRQKSAKPTQTYTFATQPETFAYRSPTRYGTRASATISCTGSGSGPGRVD